MFSLMGPVYVVLFHNQTKLNSRKVSFYSTN